MGSAGRVSFGGECKSGGGADNGPSSSSGRGDVGTGGGGGEAEVGGGGSGGEMGKGGAGSSGGGGDLGKGGAGSSGSGGLLADSSLKHTHLSSTSSLEPSSGPKMLSRSAIEGFRCPSSAASASETSVVLDGREPGGGGEVGTFLGGRGGGVPVGKGLGREESGLDSDKGAPHTSDSSITASVLISSKAVSKGGPNKAVASSGTGAFLMLGSSGGGVGAEDEWPASGATDGADARGGVGAVGGVGVGIARLGLAISSLDVFLFNRPGLRLGLLLSGEGDRAMLPMEAFSSSTEGAA